MSPMNTIEPPADFVISWLTANTDSIGRFGFEFGIRDDQGITGKLQSAECMVATSYLGYRPSQIPATPC